MLYRKLAARDTAFEDEEAHEIERAVAARRRDVRRVAAATGTVAMALTSFTCLALGGMLASPISVPTPAGPICHAALGSVVTAGGVTKPVLRACTLR